MKRILFSFFAMGLLVGFCAIDSFAQMGTKGENVERKIKFAKGKSSATVKGFIASRMTTHSWVVSGKERQTMTVVFTSTRKDVDFCIAFPNGGEPGDSCSKRKWTFILPETGNYEFIIDSKRENTPYTLTVTIK